MDDVDVLARRYDLGRDEARRLTFTGLSERPIVELASAPEAGTEVTVRLTSPS